MKEKSQKRIVSEMVRLSPVAKSKLTKIKKIIKIRDPEEKVTFSTAVKMLCDMYLVGEEKK